MSASGWGRDGSQQLGPGLVDGGQDRSAQELSTATPAGNLAAAVHGLLADATGRSLIIVVRDAHRHPVAAQVAGLLLAARPDAILLEMGLPAWQPEAITYVASFGAARSNAMAAEVLGLIRR